eukprot:1228085-Pleurochrysis_carterae.AAC.2
MCVCVSCRSKGARVQGRARQGRAKRGKAARSRTPCAEPQVLQSVKVRAQIARSAPLNPGGRSSIAPSLDPDSRTETPLPLAIACFASSSLPL